MRLCKECKNIYEGKELACPKCGDEDTCELHGVGITPTHEKVRFGAFSIGWFLVALAGLIAFAGYLIASASNRFAVTVESNLLMVASMISILTAILFVMVPVRKSKRMFLVCCALIAVIVALCLRGALGPTAVLPLALIPVTLAILLPDWQELR